MSISKPTSLTVFGKILGVQLVTTPLVAAILFNQGYFKTSYVYALLSLTLHIVLVHQRLNRVQKQIHDLAEAEVEFIDSVHTVIQNFSEKFEEDYK